jgi:hypothetical protein
MALSVLFLSFAGSSLGKREPKRKRKIASREKVLFARSGFLI